ncbi:MAG TPA: TraM recognition domain-containing protein [Guyparkeria sp.]|nr:TraM recognition domain-containing protein [Guyparkeria sp.]
MSETIETTAERAEEAAPRRAATIGISAGLSGKLQALVTRWATKLLAGRVPGLDPIAIAPAGERLSRVDLDDRQQLSWLLYHVLLSVRAAERIWHRKRALNVIIIGLTALGAVLVPMMLLAVPITWMIGAAGVGLLMTVTALIYVGRIGRKLAPAQLIDEHDEAAAKAVIRRALLRDLPDNAPADLSDRFRLPFCDEHGRPVSEVGPDDVLDETLRAEAMAYLVRVALLCTMPVAIFTAPVPALGIIVMTYMSLIAGGAGITWMMDRSPMADRMLEVEETSGQRADLALHLERGGDMYGQVAQRARSKQLDRAISDQSPFFTLGTSTGIFESRGDSYAPNPGLPFGYTAADMSVPSLVLGGSGTGKTSSFFRPVAKQWASARAGGMLILDGKGQLPAALVPQIGGRLISPGVDTFSLTEGLGPIEFVQALEEVYARDAVGDAAHWAREAGHVLRQAAVLLHASSEDWTAYGVYQTVMSPDYRSTVIESIRPEHADDPLVDLAASYWANEVPEIPEKSWGSIQSTVREWYVPLFSSRELLEWAQADSGVDPAGVLSGQTIGFDVPKTKYGSGAAMIAALVKARVYRSAKNRGDGWRETAGQTPALIIVDEAQAVVSDDDTDIAPEARSLGLVLVFGTQTIEGMHATLGEHRTKKLTEVCSNLIALPGRSRSTDDWIADRIGDIWRARIEHVAGTPSAHTAITSRLQSGVVSLARHDEYVGRLVRAEGVPALHAPYAAISSKVAEALGELGDGVLGSIAPSPTTTEIGLHPLVQGGEVETLLAEPFTAICQVVRGGVLRRDVIRMTPDFS